MENKNYTKSNSYSNGFNNADSIGNLKKSNSCNNITDYDEIKRKADDLYRKSDELKEHSVYISTDQPEQAVREMKETQNLRTKAESIYAILVKERGSLDDLLKAKEITDNELLKAVYCKKIINLSNKWKLENNNINIEELENYFKSITSYENEDEKSLLESCVDGNLEISDGRLYRNKKEIKLENIKDNIIETAFKLCCLADNSALVKMLLEDKNILNIKGKLLNCCTNEENPFLSYIIRRVCVDNCPNVLKVLIGDDDIVKSLLKNQNLGIIRKSLNEGGAANSHKTINLLLDSKEILNNVIVSDRIVNGCTCTMNNLGRDISCFANNCAETTEVYLKNDLVRRTMIEEKNKGDFDYVKKGDSYIVGHYRTALALGYLDIVKLILSYNDIMEHIADYDEEILSQTLEETYKQDDLELIEKLGKYDKNAKQHLIDTLKNNKLEIFEILVENGVKFEENSGRFIHFEKKDKIIFDTIKKNLKKIGKKYSVEYNEKILFHLGNNLIEDQSYVINLKEMNEVLDRIRIKIEENNNREYCRNLREKISEYDDKINSNLSENEKEDTEYKIEKKSLSRLLAENVNCIDDIYKLCFDKLVSIDDKDKLKCLLKVLNIEPKNNKEKAKKEKIKSEILKLQTELFKIPITNESDIKLLNNCVMGDLNNFKINYDKIKSNIDITSLLTKGFELACACGNLNIVEYILKDENLKNIIVNIKDEDYYYDIFLRVIEKGEISIFEKIIACGGIRQKLVNRQKGTLGNDGPIYYWYSILSNNSDKITDKEYEIEELSLFFSYPETIELIKNNTNFMLRCIPYFARNNYPLEIIKQIFNDSLVSGIDNFSILNILQEIVTCKRLDIVELILDFEQFKSFSIGLKIELMEESINLAFEQKNFELIKKILRANLVSDNAIIETFKIAFEQDNLELISYMLFENDKTRELILDKNILARYSENMFKNGQINNILEYLISHNDSKIAKEVCNIDKLLECFKIACEKGHLYVVKEFIKNENIRKILSDKIIDLYNFAFNSDLDNITIEIFNCEKDNIIEKDQNGNVLKKHLSILLSKNQINEFIKLFEEQNIKEKIVNDREFFNMVFANILYTGNIEFLKKILKNLDPKNTTERQLVMDCFYFFYTRNNDTILFNKILNEDDIKEKFRESNTIDKNTIFYKALIGSDFDLVDKLVRRDINFRNTTEAFISVKNESDFKNIKSNIKKLFNRYSVSYNETDVFDEHNHSINVTNMGERLVEIKNSIDYCEKLREEIHNSYKIALSVNKAGAERMENNCNRCEKSKLLSKNAKTIDDIYQFYISEEVSIGNENKLKCLIKVSNIEPTNDDERVKKDEVAAGILRLQAELFGNTANEDITEFLTECIKGNVDEPIAFYNENKSNNEMIPILIKGFKLACTCENSDIIKEIFKNDILKNIIINNNDNYDFFKSLVVEGNDSIIEILVNDNDFRKKLIEVQKEEEYNGIKGPIYECVNEFCVAISEQNEKTIKILLLHTDVVNSFINNKTFRERDFRNYIMFSSIEAIKLVFNDSIIPNMDKDDILMYFKYGFECGRLDFIELLLNCKRIKSTEDGNYIIKETLKFAYEEFYEKNNPTLLMNLMSYNDGKLKDIIVKNGILLDYVKDLFKDGKVYILDYFLSNNSELKGTIFKDNTLSECLKLACENGHMDIFNYVVYNLIKNQEIENKIFEDNSKTLFECCNLALLNDHAEIAMEMFNDSKIRKNIIENDNDGKLVSYYALRFYSNGDFNKFKELFENKEAREKIIKNKGSFDMIMINICGTDNIELLRMIFKNLDKNDYPRAMEEYLQKCSINTFNLLLGDEDISRKIDIDTLYSKLEEVSDNEKIEELLKSDISEIVVEKIKSDIRSFVGIGHEVLKIAFVKGDYELAELLIKNDINFTGPIYFDRENELDKLCEFKKHFKYIANKYGFYFDDSIFIDNNENLTKMQNIMDGIKEKIKNREELFEFIIDKNRSENNSVNNRDVNIEDNRIEQKINKLSNISKKLANYNLNKDSKFAEYYLPEIRDNDNTIVEGGFGGTTTFKKGLFNDRTVEITFKKNGFLREILENNNIVSDEILNILKGSLIIEQGRNWKNFDESRLINAILMFFKTDPATAFEMLLYLEKEGVIKLKKKRKERFSLPRRLKDSEKEGISQSFDFVVKLRKQLMDIVEFKNNIIKNSELSDDSRNDFVKILDLGINILCRNNRVKIDDENHNTTEEKNSIIENVSKLFGFVTENLKNQNRKFDTRDVDDKTEKNSNNDKFTEILEILNRENESNEYSLLDDLNSCINIIDSKDVDNSCTVQ